MELQTPPPPAGAIEIAAAPPPPAGAVAISPDHGSDFVSHTGTGLWENAKGMFSLATGADLWSHALDSAKKGDYAESAKAFQGIVDGPAKRVADSLLDTASVSAGHMKDAATKLMHGDVKGADDAANKASLHMTTVLAPHAETAAELWKQGKYGAAGGDVFSDVLTAAAMRGIHAAPKAAGAVVDAAGTAVNAVKNAATDHPVITGMAKDAGGVIAPNWAKRVDSASKLVNKVRGVMNELKPATDGTPAPGGRPIGAPQPMTPAEMRTPQFEEMPDVPRRTDVPADPAAQPAAAASSNKDAIAQGFKYKNFAAIKDPNIAATVERLAEQQDARDAAAKPAAAAPPPPPTGAVPIANAAKPAAEAIPRAETLKADVAKELRPGTVRENPDGSRQVLQHVPLEKIEGDPGNTIYEDKAAEYQKNGYSVHPELRAGEGDGYVIQEGHHRILADHRNGKKEVLAWTPEPAAAAESPTLAPTPAAEPPAAATGRTLLQSLDEHIAQKKAARLAAEAAAKPPEPPPGEAGAPGSTAATPPAPASPAAPAAAAPPYGKQYITPGQVERYATDNGLSQDDAAAALEKQGVSVVDRASTNRVLHGIGAELGYNHGTLSEIAHATYGQGLGKITHEQMMELAEKLGNEQGTKEPLATKRTGTPADPKIAPEPEGSPLGGVVQQLKVSDIHADPVRFQFKAGMGQGGAGEELRSVTKFDPEKSGILSVWKDPADGKTYVVNGHHRLELAQRTGAPDVTVRYIDAATAEEARAKGAMINIAEGRGTSIDAAKVFRDSGLTPADLERDGTLSSKGAVAKEGLALANLDPNLFNQVVSGEMKPARGAMIGQVAEHSDQQQLVKLISEREKSGKPMTDGQVAELLRMQAPQVTETQHSLFGDDEVSRSLIAEKAGVSDYIQGRLTQTRRTFNAVANERAATRLAEAGNVIDVEKNAAIAEATNQEHAVYQKLSTSTGAVDDALNEAAKALHAGENPAIVKVRTYAKIKPILEEQADKLTGRSGAPAERSEGSAQAGSSEAGRGKHDQPQPAEDLEAQLVGSLTKAAREKRATKVSDLMR